MRNREEKRNDIEIDLKSSYALKIDIHDGDDDNKMKITTTTITKKIELNFHWKFHVLTFTTEKEWRKKNHIASKIYMYIGLTFIESTKIRFACNQYCRKHTYTNTQSTRRTAHTHTPIGSNSIQSARNHLSSIYSQWENVKGSRRAKIKPNHRHTTMAMAVRGEEVEDAAATRR